MSSKVLSAQKVLSSGPLRTAFGNWYFKLSGYNKYGLYHDDCLREDEEIAEAVRRLTPEQFHDRQWRLIRACHLSTMKKILPENEWVTYEDDAVNGRYLKKMVERIYFEKKERQDWDSGDVSVSFKF